MENTFIHACKTTNSIDGFDHAYTYIVYHIRYQCQNYTTILQSCTMYVPCNFPKKETKTRRVQ